MLHALYATADICIVSAVQDGLNLVSFEYVASQVSGNGVLMLSLNTGAAQILDSVVTFNPWDTPRFANAIAEALDMPQEERERRLEGALKAVNYWTR
jgi:trehalose 6-phosphate synthase